MRKGEMMMKIIAINPIPFKKRRIEFQNIEWGLLYSTEKT